MAEGLSPTRSRTQLEQLVRDFLVHCRSRRLSSKTVEDTYRPRLDRQLLPWCAAEGITHIGQLDRRALERYQAHLFEDGSHRKRQLSTFTVNSYVRTVNVFLAWAREEGETTTANARLAREPSRVVETLTREEIAAMEKAATVRDALIVRLLADTGIRASELCGLRVDDLVDRDHYDYIKVRGKGEKERLVPVPAATARRLRHYIRSRSATGSTSDRVFLSLRRNVRTGEYEPVEVSGLEQLIRSLARNAGLTRRVYPHIFRHTYISELLKRRVDSTKVRRVVGHSSTQLIDRVYGHLLHSDLAGEVLDALAEP
jgi:integrase/recombinase XerD